jgi:ribosomal protein S18 acetylase RimI-like enzyme
MKFTRRSRVVVREPTAQDAHGIAQVLVESWLAAYAGLLPDKLLAGMSVTDRQRQLEGAFAAPTPPGAVRLVAQQHGVIIGFANAGMVPPTDDAADALAEPQRAAEIAVLYVAPTHWRQGVGRKLLRRVMRRLAVEDCTEVRAWVVDGNDSAVAFFMSQGWTRATRERRELMDGHVVLQTQIAIKLDY